MTGEHVEQDRLYLTHIAERVARITSYTEDGRAAFMASPLLQDAVIRNFEVIGEAVKGLSPACLARRPEVQWSRIAGFRDVLIHNYMGVDLEAVWNTVEAYLPQLEQAVDELLDALGKE